MQQTSRESIEEYIGKIEEVRSEIHRVLIGQEEIVSEILKVLLCKGHMLLEGVPGVGKTLSVLTLSKTIKDSTFGRIQFTPDLLPTDITGVTVYEKEKGFYTIKGPVFANIVVADEINRSPPKVQSAMLQAMAEREVTIGKKTLPLPDPFFVLATQNPVETRGVYPLPEAQIDRFLFKIDIKYPKKSEESVIIDRNIDLKPLEDYGVEQVISLKELLTMQDLVKHIYLSYEVKRYIVSLVDATRYPTKYGIPEAKFMQWGASPRASINLALSARATAFMNSRDYVTPDDVRAVAYPVLRHRIILNYEGKAREISTDKVVEAIIKKVPVM